MSVTQDRDRLDLLNLSIEPDETQRAEIAALTKKCRNQPHVDDSDPDPDGIASGMHMSWHELYRKEQKMNEYRASIAERYYAKRGKEMNSHFSRS